VKCEFNYTQLATTNALFVAVDTMCNSFIVFIFQHHFFLLWHYSTCWKFASTKFFLPCFLFLSQLS